MGAFPQISLPGVVFLLIGVILHAANPTPGTVITDLPVPLVVEGKTVGSITLKAGTQVSVITVLPNESGVVISRGEGSPFVVPKTALSKESILLAIATASATPTPAPTPIAVANPSPATTAKPSSTSNSTTNQVGAAAETDFIITGTGGIATITGYRGVGGNLVIPNTIQGLPVGVIGREAFAEAKILSVVIPSSVTKMEGGSFQCCHSLTKIMLPKDLVEFGGFGWGLDNLKEITIDPGNQNFAVGSDGVLFDSTKTQLLAYPAGKKETLYSIPDTVKELGAYSFAAGTRSKNLRSVDLPESLTQIGKDAFNGSGIHNVTIPNSVKTIGNFAFRCSPNLTNVSIGKGVEEMGAGVFFGCGKLQKAQFEGNAPIVKANNTFKGTDRNFKVYYHANADGFSSPNWDDSGGGRWDSVKIEN